MVKTLEATLSMILVDMALVTWLTWNWLPGLYDLCPNRFQGLTLVENYVFDYFSLSNLIKAENQISSHPSNHDLILFIINLFYHCNGA